MGILFFDLTYDMIGDANFGKFLYFCTVLVLHKGSQSMCPSMKNWCTPLCRFIKPLLLSGTGLDLVLV